MIYPFFLTLLSITLTMIAGEPPHFRILAPEFVCSKDEDAPPVDTDSDNTIITLRTSAGAKLDMRWIVRWTPLPAPTQRLTLMLWRATRELEKKLNGPQNEPYVYAIENDELLAGVDYRFNVTASNAEGEETTKTFHINNVKGDQVVENLEGRTGMLSIMLIGGQETYADIEFTLEAVVTTCHPTQDYYFLWSVENSSHKVDASPSGRLELPAYSLAAGLTYLVTCQVVSHSTGEFITQNTLPLTVVQRTFEVYLSVDYLEVSVNTAFTLESVVLNHDYFGDSLTYHWKCSYEGEECSFFKSVDSSTLLLESGLPTVGKFDLSLTVHIHNHSVFASAVVRAAPHVTPVIQISPLPRTLNEGSKVLFVANASNVTPSCSLTWYFASEEYMQSQKAANDTCVDCQHGVPLTDTLTIFSLEENFLYYLTDFSNETEWRQMSAEMAAAAGRARFLVKCGCSLTVACENQGIVYADVYFKVNGIPKANPVMVTPTTGTALETIYRISTLAVVDENYPLFYTFYCRVGLNSSLVLGAYAEHLAVETFLPYMEDGVELWVEVCDVLGACSTSAPIVVDLLTGDGTTVEELLNDVRAHVRRCELMKLQRVSVAAVVTYKNTGQNKAFDKFCADLLISLPASQNEHCLKTKLDRYEAFLMQLTEIGCDATRVLNT